MGQDGSQAIIDITSLEQFKEIVRYTISSSTTELKKIKIYQINGEQNNVIVDFWASWCGPCRVISPLFQKLAIQAPDHVGLYKVNIDEVADVAKEFKIKAVRKSISF